MKTMKLIGSATLMLALVVSVNTQAQPKTSFNVEDPMKRNTVTFKSMAPLEDIIGTSNEISGTLEFDPAKPEAGGSGMLSVPVASLDTGIPLRDEHLANDQWLDAGKYADITFKIVEVKDVKAVKVNDEAKTFDVVAVGDFSLRGKTKRMEVPARITWLKETEVTKARQPGDLLAARATFDVKLADFGVTGPAGMDLIGSKVGESVTIEFSVVASSASAK